MFFNSLSFLIFFPLVVLIYFIIPRKVRYIWLLIASYYFYMSWNVKFVFLILFTTLVSYLAAILIEKKDDKSYKKVVLGVSAILCLGVLFVFKYFNFISESFTSFVSLFSIHLEPLTLKLLLPVGISFYTFQTLSYVIDVYRGNVPAEHHFGYYAAFVSFFPQLVAGPIERTNNLLPQIKATHNFDYSKATYGLKLMTWGFFKKIVVADTISRYVNHIYGSPQKFSGFVLILATIFFSVQIYCDFSGYSDIAVGTAKLFGIDLMTNFKSPYFSQSIKEFWGRWHISLSSWLKDYVYIPLGGNRVGKIRHYFNLIVTFLVSGLWHGANWTYVVWGAIHGFLQVTENIIFPNIKLKQSKIIICLRVIFVFILCSFAWIFFVSNSIDDAIYVIKNLFDGISSPLEYLANGFINLDITKLDLISIVVSSTVLAVYDYVSLTKDVIAAISSKKVIIRWAIYCLFVLWVILRIPSNSSPEFIYFQF